MRGKVVSSGGAESSLVHSLIIEMNILWAAWAGTSERWNDLESEVVTMGVAGVDTESAEGGPVVERY